MSVSRLRQTLAVGRPTFGAWCSLSSSYSAEILAAAGFDFLVIDCQHGLIGYEAMLGILQAVSRTGVAALVRVAENRAAAIGAALDAGAEGVVVPMVNVVADAEAAVAASKYPPLGRRSFGPARSALVVPGTPQDVNGRIITVALLETEQGVASAPDICRVPGIDSVMIGWADLAMDMGIPVGKQSSRLEDAVAGTVATCTQAGVPIMMSRFSADRRLPHHEYGAKLVLLTTDVALVRSGASSALAQARGSEDASD
jgi:4-hydroxy-2-oxoheptanedioate aldolase